MSLDLIIPIQCGGNQARFTVGSSHAAPGAWERASQAVRLRPLPRPSGARCGWGGWRVRLPRGRVGCWSTGRFLWVRPFPADLLHSAEAALLSLAAAAGGQHPGVQAGWHHDPRGPGITPAGHLGWHQQRPRLWDPLLRAQCAPPSDGSEQWESKFPAQCVGLGPSCLAQGEVMSCSGHAERAGLSPPGGLPWPRPFPRDPRGGRGWG